jgi:hypothetical protein
MKAGETILIQERETDSGKKRSRGKQRKDEIFS